MRWWHLGLLAAVLGGCATVVKKRDDESAPEPTPDPPPLPPEPTLLPPELFVFVHDLAFIAPVRNAARRIEAASGIKVHVNEYGTLPTAIPIYGSDFLCGNGVDGRTTDTWIALARDCKVDTEKVALHELMHKLGVGHLELPLKGIMNKAGDAPLDKISEDDLTALCAVRDCPKFQPEV